MRRLFFTLRNVLVAAAFVLFAALIAAKLDDRETERSSGPFRAGDGDSLSLVDVRYRLLGIDAPELFQTCGREASKWSCGTAARDALAALVSSQNVECAGSERDRYGRLLVVCHADGRDINAEMVRQGMAIAYGHEEVDYRFEEEQAREARRGLWSGPFDRPGDWRRMHGRKG